MRILSAISLMVGLTLMTLLIVLPRLGGVEWQLQAAGLEPLPAQAGIAPRVSADSDREVWRAKGGAELVKVST